MTFLHMYSPSASRHGTSPAEHPPAMVFASSSHLWQASNGVPTLRKGSISQKHWAERFILAVTYVRGLTRPSQYPAACCFALSCATVLLVFTSSPMNEIENGGPAGGYCADMSRQNASHGSSCHALRQKSHRESSFDRNRSLSNSFNRAIRSSRPFKNGEAA